VEAHARRVCGVTFHAAPETDLAVFTDDGGFALDVRVEANSVWLTQKQMATLFNTTLANVNLHLLNIFKEAELAEEATIKEYLIVQNEGGRLVQRPVLHYSLDAILSVGYRINSRRGTQFRIWANTVLRDHLLKGYTLNAARLEQRGVTELQSAITLLGDTLASHSLVTDEGRAILDIVRGYARSWNLLLAYDDGTLPQPAAHKQPKTISTTEARAAISTLKRNLLDKGEATDLFAQERGEQFDAIITGLAQEVFGTTLYPTVESRAAHLLYFVIKDHPFSDGNKRVGSFLFINYLAAHHLHRTISDTALVALALLTAQSDPKQKDLVIRLIMNLIG
jgi:hypothetical protein